MKIKYQKISSMSSLKSLKKVITQKKRLNISFWGGEPLLAFNEIKYIIDSFESIKRDCADITYIILTNGTVINDEIIDLCKKKKIILQITIDGDKESHDSYRYFDQRKGSFDLICKNVKYLREKKVHYFIRTTITNKTQMPNELLEYYRNNGMAPEERNINDKNQSSSFNNYKGGGIGYGIVNYKKQIDSHDIDISPNINNIESIVDSIIESYCKDSSSHKLFYHSNINRTHDSFFYPIKKQSCGVGNRKITIRYDGSFYLCHRFASDTKFSIGDVYSGIDYKKFDEYRKLYSRYVENNLNCRYCQYKHECGGTCFHEAIIYGINYINNSICHFNKKDVFSFFTGRRKF